MYVLLLPPDCCLSWIIYYQSHCKVSILLAGGTVLSRYTMDPVRYPSVCFQLLDLHRNVSCNVWAIWQLFIKRQYARPLSGLWIRASDKIQLMLQSQFSTAALGHITGKLLFYLCQLVDPDWDISTSYCLVVKFSSDFSLSTTIWLQDMVLMV